MRSVRYAFAMPSSQYTDQQLTALVQKAVDEVAGGSADKLGRMLGYANGGYIREITSGKKPVRRMLISRFKAATADPRLPGWFGDGSSPAVAVDPPDEVGHFAPRRLVDVLADNLVVLSEQEHRASIEACRRLAESPDSQRARDGLQELLGHASVVSSREAVFRHALGMLADKWPVQSEQPVIQRFLETVDKFMAEEGKTLVLTHVKDRTPEQNLKTP